jgi:hypothetical protein
MLDRVARWYIFNLNLGKFLSILQWKMLENFMAIRSILLLFHILYGHLVCFVVILLYFCHFGILCQEKSGNPDARRFRWSFKVWKTWRKILFFISSALRNWKLIYLIAKKNLLLKLLFSKADFVKRRNKQQTTVYLSAEKTENSTYIPT